MECKYKILKRKNRVQLSICKNELLQNSESSDVTRLGDNFEAQQLQ